MTAEKASSPVVRVEGEGRVAFIVIDHPPINAGSAPVRQGLLAALQQVGADPGIEAAVVIGAGRTFMAGSDLREFSAPLSDPQLPAVIAAIEACPKPVVAAIHGAALGGGFELALACDGRIAAEGAVVGLPEGTFGIIPGAGGTVRLPRVVDAATALEIIVSCRRVKAREAKTLGMVDALASGDLRAEAAAFALALGGAKRRLRDLPALPVTPDALAQAEQAALRRGRSRPHVAEAIAAVRRAVAEPFDDALREERAVFQRLRLTEESAALRAVFFAEREAAQVEGVQQVKGQEIRSVGIVGGGTMGCGIAAAFLLAGMPVLLTDAQAETRGKLHERVTRLVAEGKSDCEPGALTVVESIEQLSGCDLIVEAVFEDLGVKTALMAALDRIAKPSAILASNTSYLDLDLLAAATSRPQAVVGLHFFAPAQIMKLLEIVRGAKTSPETLASALAVGRRLGKVCVVARVCEGFIGNRIYNAYRTECEAMLLEGATPAQVDAALRTFGFAMGPFAVSDLSGLDIAWANRRRRQQATGDRSDLPVLEWLVGEGRLGRKTGAGWYRYADGSSKPEPDDHVLALLDRASAERGVTRRPLTAETIQRRALDAIIREGRAVVAQGIAARESDVDLVLIYGYGFPKHTGGPLHWAARQHG